VNKKAFVLVLLLLFIPSIFAIVENNVVGDLVDQSGNPVTNARVNVYSTAYDSTCSLLANLNPEMYTECGCPVTCELNKEVYTYVGHFSESPRFVMNFVNSHSCDFINVAAGGLCDSQISPDLSYLWTTIDASTATPPISLQLTTDQTRTWDSYWSGAVNAYYFGELLLRDSDGDGYNYNVDCDDEDASINPAATEVCDTIDNDCDGVIDEGVEITYYLDSDGDSFGNPSQITLACSAPDGYVLDNADCVDNNNLINPSQEDVCNGIDDNCVGGVDEGNVCPTNAYYCDTDSDSYLSSDISGTCDTFDCIPDGCSSSQGNDCDDGAANVKPGATETCNLIDDNCNSQIDEGVENTYYQDSDGDSFGNVEVIAEECILPDGYVEDNTDCDDTQSGVRPGAIETCNLIDDNCDGAIDEGVETIYYLDSDDDNYGNPSESTLACSAPSGYILDNTDCVDNNNLINPSQEDVCNGIDDNCVGGVDENDVCPSTAYYCDTDSDSYLSSDVSGTCGTFECIPDGCSSSQGNDCDDTTSSIKPGVAEVCNLIDDNCDGQVDEGVENTYYQDSDGDSFGNVEVIAEECILPDGYVVDNTDCDDTKSGVKPGATETCNLIDDNCDGAIDESVKNTYYLDSDDDNYGDSAQVTLACTLPVGYIDNSADCDDANPNINPAQNDVCNDVDDNCVAGVDEDNVCPSTAYYCDGDGDDQLSSSVRGSCDTFECIPDGCSSSQGTDCDDGDSAVKIGAVEICNLIDDNCVDGVDEGVETTYYQDSDGDTFGNVEVIAEECSAPSGYVEDNTDCDDTKSSVNPSATEICNEIDDNCVAGIDEEVELTYYLDSDNDNYGDASQTTLACSAPDGYVDDNTDCVDNNVNINPSQNDVCNGVDDNCAAGVDEDNVCPTNAYYCDDDGDGQLSSSVSGSCDAFECIPDGCSSSQGIDCNDGDFAVKIGAVEICNLIDDNCVNGVDEGVETTYYQDLDGDTFGNLEVIAEECSVPSGYVEDNTDCDDTKSASYPGNSEVCDGVDNNCVSGVDELGVCGVSVYYCDVDVDGYISNVPTDSCSTFECVPSGCILEPADDCDDSLGVVNPGVTEVCYNSIDDNCNGEQDEGCDLTGPAVNSLIYYPLDVGIGKLVNITAEITDETAVENVLIGITLDDVETNYTMLNHDSIYYYEDTYWTNGTRLFRIYAKDTLGLMNYTEIIEIPIYADNIKFQVKTLQDLYNEGETVGLTDPPGLVDAAILYVASEASEVEAANTISTCQQLQDINCNTDYELANDIDCTGFDYGDGKGFKPLCPNGYKKTFDGKGRKIINLNINRPSENYVGLFADAGGKVYVGGKVRDIRLVNPYVRGKKYVGAIAGGISGGGGVYFINVEGGQVIGTNTVGGLVGIGIMDSKLDDSFSSATVTGSSNYGALLGHSSWVTTIRRSFATGSISNGEGVLGKNTKYDNEYNVRAYTFCDSGRYSNCNQATPKSTALMKTKSTYTDTGAWSLAPDNDNDGYPTGNTKWTMAEGSYPRLWDRYNEVDCDNNDAAEHPGVTWYLDQDNDGYYLAVSDCKRGSGTAANWKSSESSYNPIASGDCDDGDVNAWIEAQGYLDADNDGYNNDISTVCYGNSLPAGFSQTQTAVVDCDPDNQNMWEDVDDLYVDEDQDGLTTGSPATHCVGNSRNDIIVEGSTYFTDNEPAIVEDYIYTATSLGQEKTTPEEDQSKIENLGDKDMSLYFVMNVEKFDGNEWVFVQNIIDDVTSQTKRDVNVNRLIALDLIWNEVGWPVTYDYESGLYRVVITATDPEGNVLLDKTGNELVTNYEFDVIINSAPVHDQDPTLTTLSGKNFDYENLTCNSFTSDIDNDPIRNVYGWNKNGQPLTVLNIPFEGGEAKDYSGNENDGIINGATQTTGIVGSAMSFDGVDDYVDLGDKDIFEFGGVFTASLWVKTTSDDLMYLLTKFTAGANYEFLMNTNENGGMTFGVLACNGASSLDYVLTSGWLNDGNWHQITGATDGSLLRLYIDGVFVGEDSTINSAPCQGGNGPLLIGSVPPSGNLNRFMGEMDEVNIYNYALSEEQIIANYKAGLEGKGNDMIVSAETNLGESWYCSVTPTDGKDDGEIVNSNTLTIGVNTAPTITSVPKQEFDELTEEIPNTAYSGEVATHTNVVDLYEYASDSESTDEELSYNLGTQTNPDSVSCWVDGERYVSCSHLDDKFGLSNVELAVSDGRFVTTDNFDVEVFNVNDAPWLTSTIPDITFEEDTSTDIDLDDYLFDVDNDYVDIIWIKTSTDNIIVDINSETHVTYFSAPANWFGSEQVTFTATDLGGLSISQSITITVTAFNDAPEIEFDPEDISEDQFNIGEDSEFNDDLIYLPSKASDLETNSVDLIYTIVSQEDTNIVNCVIDDGLNLDCTTQTNMNGNSQIVVRVDDGQEIAEDSLIISVGAVDDPPEIDTITDKEYNEDLGIIDNLVDLHAISDDVETTNPADLTYSISQEDSTIIACTLDSNQYIDCVTQRNMSGSSEVVVQVSDDNSLDETSFTIEVIPVNDLPEVNLPTTITFDEDEEASLALDDYITDVDNAKNEITWTYSGNTNIIVDLDSNVHIIGFSAPTNWNGAETITISAEDPLGDSIPTDVLVTIDAINDGPTFSFEDGDNKDFDEDANGEIIVSLPTRASDVETNTADLTYTITTQTRDDIVVCSIDANKNLYCEPQDDQSGISLVTVKVSDGDTELDVSSTVTISVGQVNDPPTLDSFSNILLLEDFSEFTDIDLHIKASDVETTNPADLIYSISQDDNTAVLCSIVENRYLYCERQINESGSSTVTVSVTDLETQLGAQDELTTTQDFEITVTAVNDAPAITLGDITFEEDTITTIILNDFFVDVDNIAAEMTWTAVDQTSIDVGIESGVATISAPTDWNGAEDVTFTVRDSDGATGSKEVSITINPINDAPSIEFVTEDNKNFQEDDAGEIIVSLPDRADDVETLVNDLTYTITTQTRDDVVVCSIDANKNLYCEPVPQKFGSSEVSVRVSDGDNELDDISTVIISVGQVNDPPVLTAFDDIIIVEDFLEFNSIDLHLKASDVETTDSADLIYSISQNDDIAVLCSIVGNQYLNCERQINESGSSIVTVSVTDLETESGAGDQITVQQEFTVTVNPVNDAPAVTLDDITFDEDTITTVTLNDFFVDVDNVASEMTWTAVNQDNIDVDIGSGVATIYAPTDWNGDEDVTFTVNDLNDASGSKTVKITVNAINDGPTIEFVTEDNKDFDEDAEGEIIVSLPARADDVETDVEELIYTITTQTRDDIVDCSIDANNNLYCEPQDDQSGNSQVTVSVSDGETELDDTSTITISVGQVNDPPVLQDIDDVVYLEDFATIEVVDLYTKASDVETGDSDLIYSISQDSNVVVLCSLREDRYIDCESQINESGSSIVTISVTDLETESGAGDQITVTKYFTITVDPVNDAPAVTLDDITFEEDTITTVILNDLFVDVDNVVSEMTWIAVGQNNINVDIVEGIATISASTDWNGDEDVTFTVTDLDYASGSKTITITVTAVNDAPSIEFDPEDNKNFQEDDAGEIIVSLPARADDVETDSADLIYTIALQEDVSIVDCSIDADNNLVCDPQDDQSGTSQVTVSVSDGDAELDDSSIVIISVGQVNDPPILDDLDPMTLLEDFATFNIIDLHSKAFDVETIDSDLVYTLSQINGEVVSCFIVDNQYLNCESQADEFGSSTVTVAVTDLETQQGANDQLTVTKDFIITVTPDNDGPIVTLANLALDEDTTLTIILDDFFTDVDNEASEMTWTATGQADINVVINGGIATISAPTDWNGDEDVIFTVTDLGYKSDSKSITITVNAINDGPSIEFVVNDNKDFDEDTEGEIVVHLPNRADDVETNEFELTYTIVAETGLSVVDCSIDVNKNLYCEPQPNQFGSSQVTVRVSDGDVELDDTSTVTISVGQVNDAPVLQDIDDVVYAEDFVTIEVVDLHQKASDVETGDTDLIYSISQDVTDIVLCNLRESRYIDCVGLSNKVGDTVVTVTVTDLETQLGADDEITVTKDFTITVTPENDAPTISDISDVDFDEDTSLTISLDQYVDDIDNIDEQITWTAVSTDLTVEIVNRVATITAPLDWDEQETITFRAADLEGLFAEDSLLISVNSINDAPVVDDIQDQQFDEDTVMEIDLNAYVNDPDNLDNQLIWTVTGYVNLVVIFDANRHATLSAPTNWNGQEILTFTATDPSGLFGEDSFTIGVMGINDAPNVDSLTLTSPVGDYVYEDLTCNAVTSDVDGDSVRNITTWIKNNAPISIINIPFDNQNEPVTDYSTNSYDGVVSGAVWNSDGLIGGAMSFDGVDDFINFGSLSELEAGLSELTVSAWVNSNTLIGNHEIMRNVQTDNSGQFMLRLVGDKIRFGVNTGNYDYVETIGTVSAQTWHNIVGVWDGSQIMIYVDGQLDSAKSQTGTLSTAVNNLAIGCFDANNQNSCAFGSQFNGLIDEVNIYNIALSAEQIDLNYQVERYSQVNNKIVAAHTSLDDAWQCVVTPTDSMADGTMEPSNIITIKGCDAICDNTCPSYLCFGDDPDCDVNGDVPNNDNDGFSDSCDPDDDNDGREDELDIFPLDPTEQDDTDGDGFGNNGDTDDDNDGAIDSGDAFPLDFAASIDTDSDGAPDSWNGNCDQACQEGSSLIIDTCPNDAENDFDLDELCADDDVCPHDVDNDVDNDGFCAGDGFKTPKVGDNDPCPTEGPANVPTDNPCVLGWADGCWQVNPNPVFTSNDCNLCQVDIIDSCSGKDLVQGACLTDLDKNTLKCEDKITYKCEAGVISKSDVDKTCNNGVCQDVPEVWVALTAANNCQTYQQCASTEEPAETQESACECIKDDDNDGLCDSVTAGDGAPDQCLDQGPSTGKPADPECGTYDFDTVTGCWNLTYSTTKIPSSCVASSLATEVCMATEVEYKICNEQGVLIDDPVTDSCDVIESGCVGDPDYDISLCAEEFSKDLDDVICEPGETGCWVENGPGVNGGATGNCCGDDADECWLNDDNSGSCCSNGVEVVYLEDADKSQKYCNLLAGQGNSPGLCDANGEEYCWYNAAGQIDNAPCCGDDGNEDTWQYRTSQRTGDIIPVQTCVRGEWVVTTSERTTYFNIWSVLAEIFE